MGQKSEIGKYLKKMRIDHNETMSDMAKNLQVSTAFLSAVETGKRKIPSSMISKICTLYNLNSQEKDAFFEAIASSGDKVDVYFVTGDEKRNAIAISIATALSNLDNTQIEEIKRIIERGDKDEKQEKKEQ